MKSNNLKNLITLFRWLKYNKCLNYRYVYRQLKTRFFCKYFHKKWDCLRYTHSVWKYIQCGYRCNKCNSVHYEIELNK